MRGQKLTKKFGYDASVHPTTQSSHTPDCDTNEPDPILVLLNSAAASGVCLTSKGKHGHYLLAFRHIPYPSTAVRLPVTSTSGRRSSSLASPSRLESASARSYTRLRILRSPSVYTSVRAASLLARSLLSRRKAKLRNKDPRCLLVKRSPTLVLARPPCPPTF